MTELHLNAWPVPLTESRSRMIRFLEGKKRIHLQGLSPVTRFELAETLNFLHHDNHFSILEISRRLGRSQFFVWSLYNRLSIPMRGSVEANRISIPLRSKHPRTSFAGEMNEKLYLQGFAHGDLDVRQTSGTAISVSSTSTHPSFVSLFESLFRDYGPTYRYPVFDKTSGYRWKVAARLDNSFSFLLPQARSVYPMAGSPSSFFAWIAGIIDSDGSLGIIHSGKYVRINIEISNQELNLLLHIKRELIRLGYYPTGPYKRSSEGDVTSRWNIKYNRDLYYLAIQRVEEVRSILELAPLAHSEKREKKQLILTMTTPTKWKAEKKRILVLRNATRRSVQEFVRSAKVAFENRRMGKATLVPSPVSRRLPTS